MRALAKNGKILTVGGKVVTATDNTSVYEWSQIRTDVKNYLQTVDYTDVDPSVSYIEDYAPATATRLNTKPVSNGYTNSDEVPNVLTPHIPDDGRIVYLKPTDTLRWMYTAAANVRDLGGWQADGGTIRYGMMFRGGVPELIDHERLVERWGVRAELALTGSENDTGVSVMGSDVIYCCPSGNTDWLWYTYQNTTPLATAVKFLFTCVLHDIPVLFHCISGADRTGTLAYLIEALLGVSRSDRAKDYELTSFSTGTADNDQSRRRNEWSYTSLEAEFDAFTGATDELKAGNFIASLGVSSDDINAFRAAMIDGTPDVLTITSATVTNLQFAAEN